MIKLLGTAMILLGSGSAGFGFARAVRAQLRQLNALLAALGNAQMLFSTISVATSFIAAALTFCRSPYYALGYAANDVVLVVLWVLAAAADPAYWSMVICFALFLINDLYGFVNWRRMQRRQSCS